jgi:hypothetical protein
LIYRVRATSSVVVCVSVAAAAVAEAHPDQAADYGSHYCKTAYHASCDGSHVGG